MTVLRLLLASACLLAGCNSSLKDHMLGKSKHKDKDDNASQGDASVAAETAPASADAQPVDLGALAAAESLPPTLLETGLFLNGDPATPAPGVVEYAVRAPFWSDGARKRRLVALPPGAPLVYDAAAGRFAFPAGTTFIKHFTTDGEPETPIETRVMVLRPDGQWAMSTYAWTAEGAAINDRPRRAAVLDKEYRLPSQKECRQCHADGPAVLGFGPAQLNFARADGQNELDRLAAAGIAFDGLDALKQVPALADPADATHPLETRVRAYLEVNCAMCHFPGGHAKAKNLDLRLAAAETYLVAEGKLVPGKPDESKPWTSFTRPEERMPPLSMRHDPVGLELLRAYIEQYPAPPQAGLRY